MITNSINLHLNEMKNQTKKINIFQGLNDFF